MTAADAKKLAEENLGALERRHYSQILRQIVETAQDGLFSAKTCIELVSVPAVTSKLEADGFRVTRLCNGSRYFTIDWSGQ